MAPTWETVTLDGEGGTQLSYLCARDGVPIERAVVCLPGLAGSAADFPVPEGFPPGTAFGCLPPVEEAPRIGPADWLVVDAV